MPLKQLETREDDRVAIGVTGFDSAFYLARNRDVAAAGIDPYQHYLSFGWREGRAPNALFDPTFYLAQNRDVAAAGIDPLTHYMQSGWREGRDPSRAFDSGDYVAANPDVAAAGVNPMIHYLRFGEAEHRAIAPDTRTELVEGFDRAFYLSKYADVAAGGMDAYVHYDRFGDSEGRSPNALFDPRHYLNANPDVAAAKADPFQHFLRFGWREGRDPSAGFDLDAYRAATGLGSDENPLIRYLTTDRYLNLPSDMYEPAPPRVIDGRGDALQAIFVGQARFVIDGAITHVSATASPLDGRDLTGFTGYSLTQSIADFSIEGQGRLPLGINLGSGDDRLVGDFTLGGGILNLFAGGGTLLVDARIDDGLASINGGAAGSSVTLRGSATTSFTGGAGDDVASLGAGNDSLAGGEGTNRLDGGAGVDLASWTGQVEVDLMLGTARGVDDAFHDTLIGIENLGGSAFDDVMLGDDRANTLYGVNVSPSVSGDDLLAGRGGDDVLWGFDGADILIGGRGSDALIGGEGADLLIDAADPWGANFRMGTLYAGEGDDSIVYLLGAPGDIARGSFADGGTGADIYIVDPGTGGWGNLGIGFSQTDGDRIDLSALRTAQGDRLTIEDVRAASSTPFANSVVIDLGAFADASGHALDGRIVVNGVTAPAELGAGDFIFAGGTDWRALVPSEALALI